MRDWSGIQRNTDFTDDAPYYVQNARYWQGGELQRRAGLEAYSAQSGISLTNFRTPTGDYFVLFQDTSGNLVSVTAS